MLAAMHKHIPRSAVNSAVLGQPDSFLKLPYSICGKIIEISAYINTGRVFIMVADVVKHSLYDINELSLIAVLDNIFCRREDIIG